MSAVLHTKGPWRVAEMGYSTHPVYICTEYLRRGGPVVHGSAGAIAKLPHSKFHNIEANARRIVQCVNACEGLPNDALDGGWTALGMSHYAKSLEDALAEAIDWIETVHEGEYGHNTRRDDMADKLRAALSKATSQPPTT